MLIAEMALNVWLNKDGSSREARVLIKDGDTIIATLTKSYSGNELSLNPAPLLRSLGWEPLSRAKRKPLAFQDNGKVEGVRWLCQVTPKEVARKG